jgi:hypothetical protein
MVEAILDAHYLSRDIQLAKAAALKLERAKIQPTLKPRRSVIEEGGHRCYETTLRHAAWQLIGDTANNNTPWAGPLPNEGAVQSCRVA